MPDTDDTDLTLAAFDTAPPPRYRDADDRVRIYLGDSLEILDLFPERSVRMIFADPPYFLSGGGPTCHSGRRVRVDKGAWDKPGDLESNHEFTTGWLDKCRRVLDDNGTIWVSGTAHVIYSVGFAMQQLGYRILNDIVWFKSNAPPNLGCRCFTHSTETILWAAKSRTSKHTFHYELMKEFAGGRQMRNMWDIRAPSKAEKKFGNHPTQKPVALLERTVLAASNSNDVILDPFSGSGTTGVAALQHGRRYIGIEREPEYVELSINRIEAALGTAQVKG